MNISTVIIRYIFKIPGGIMFQLFESTDIKILFFIQEHHRNLFLDKFIPMVTRLGDLGFFWIALACIFILIKKYRKIGIMIFCRMITIIKLRF